MDDTHETEDVESLATRAARGDQEALESLLVEIQPRVRRICGRMLLYPEDAEEATQDALMLVATRIQHVRRAEPLHHLAVRRGVQQRPLDVPHPQATLGRAAER